MDNQGLVESLINSGILKSPQIIEAFQIVDRQDFVPPELSDLAYYDTALPIYSDQTISQPTTVALMLELLRPDKGMKILDVGSGSGWTTALLAAIAGKTGQVFGVEVMPELVKFGLQNLKKYSFPSAKIMPAGKDLGLPQEAPFDRILVSASGTKMPEELIGQLEAPGIMVAPVDTSVYKVEKDGQGHVSSTELPGFLFVPLRE